MKSNGQIFQNTVSQKATSVRLEHSLKMKIVQIQLLTRNSFREQNVFPPFLKGFLSILVQSLWQNADFGAEVGGRFKHNLHKQQLTRKVKSRLCPR